MAMVIVAPGVFLTLSISISKLYAWFIIKYVTMSIGPLSLDLEVVPPLAHVAQKHGVSVVCECGGEEQDDEGQHDGEDGYEDGFGA